jgi:hypothetical protein
LATVEQALKFGSETMLTFLIKQTRLPSPSLRDIYKSISTCYTAKSKTKRKARKLIMFKILNVKSEPSRFILNWKSRDKHCFSLDNAGKTLLRNFLRRRAFIAAFSIVSERCWIHRQIIHSPFAVWSKERKSKFNGLKDEEVEPLTAFRVFSEELDLSSWFAKGQVQRVLNDL